MYLTSSPEPVRVVTLVDADDGGSQNAHGANLACLLSCAGRRVLICDLADPAQGVRHWLRELPVVEMTSDSGVKLNIAALATDMAWSAAAAAVHVRRYHLPVGAGAIDVAEIHPPRSARLSEAFRNTVRSIIDRMNYDVVLFCGLRVTPGDPLVGLAAELSDAVALCFPFTEAAARRAGAAARVLAAAGQNTGSIVPVSPLPRNIEPDRLGRIRGEVRPAFRRAAGLDAAGQPAASLDAAGQPAAGLDRAGTEPVAGQRFVEIGPPALAAPESFLTVLLDEPARSGYPELWRVLTGEAVGGVPVPDGIRRRYRWRVTGRTEGCTVWLAYAPERRPWAEWIAGALRRAGIVIRDPGGKTWASPADDDMIMVVGPVDRLPGSVQDWVDRAAAEPAPEIVQVWLDETVPAEHPGRILHLHAVPERIALARLCAHLSLPGGTAGGTTGGTTAGSATPPAAVAWIGRFPGFVAAQRVVSSPSPNPHFVGRAAELDTLRDALISDGFCLVTGAPGTGKRELVNEYGHRFGSDYDVVWWLPANEPSGLLTSLRALSDRLATQFGVRHASGSVLGALGAGDPTRRWLLVYQNADDIGLLRDSLPHPVPGHVVVISRDSDPAVLGALAGRGRVMHLPVVQPSQADLSGMLVTKLPLLSPATSAALCERLGSAPLAVHLAGATIDGLVAEARAQGRVGPDSVAVAARRYLDELDGHDKDDRVGAALRAAVSLLGRQGETGRLATALARMCAFVAADGISLNLIRNPEMLGQLAGLAGTDDAAPLVEDPTMVETIVWQGVRQGLFDIQWGTNTLRMHRVLQHALRSIMTPAERRAAQTATLTGLATSAPTEAELEAESHLALMTELGRHLQPSGALESDDRAVRHWIVKQLQSAARYGDTAQRLTACAIADEVAGRWSAPNSERGLRLRLDHQRARLMWELGRHEQAVALERAVHGASRQELGPQHIFTLLSARSAGRYLRGVGRFAEARAQANIAFEGLRATAGAGHRNTLWTAQDLALSAFLSGDGWAAARLQGWVTDRWVEQSGWEGRMAWRNAANHGWYLLELGRYADAGRQLERARRAAESTGDGVTDEETMLRIARGEAIIQRVTGRPWLAREASTRLLQERYLPAFGPDHYETLACELAVAADEHAVGGYAAAGERAARVVDGLRSVLSDEHPCFFVAQSHLGVFQLAAAEAPAARENAGSALRALRERLGEGHPWVLAAAVNHLCTTAGTQDSTSLAEAADRLAALCVQFLTATHPCTRTALANRHVPSARWQPVIVDIPQF